MMRCLKPAECQLRRHAVMIPLLLRRFRDCVRLRCCVDREVIADYCSGRLYEYAVIHGDGHQYDETLNQSFTDTLNADRSGRA